MLLYVRVILQEKKIWAVQFRQCTALIDAIICQSHFLRKKKFGRCNSDNAPPYLIQLYVRVIFQEKKIGRCNSDNAPPRAVGRCMHRPSGCNLVISLYSQYTTCKFLGDLQRQLDEKNSLEYKFFCLSLLQCVYKGQCLHWELQHQLEKIQGICNYAFQWIQSCKQNTYIPWCILIVFSRIQMVF